MSEVSVKGATTVSFRVYASVRIAASLAGRQPTATSDNIAIRAVEIADSLALELAKGDPVEQALARRFESK